MQARRLHAVALSLLLVVSWVVPIRRAEAVIPMVGLAVAAFGSGGSVVSSNLLATGVGHLIGGAILALAITPDTADAPVRIPLISDQPTIDAVMPPPSAPASAPPTSSGGAPVNTGSWARCDWYPPLYGEQWGCGSSYSTYSACASGYLTGGVDRACINQTVGASNYGVPYGPAAVCSRPDCVATDGGTVCPSGYAVSGTSCVLNNARAAVSDGNADVKRAGSAFAADASEQDALPAYVSVQNGKLVASGKDSSGRPVMVEYSVSQDGTKTYIRHYTQSETSGGSVVNTATATVNTATGQVEGIQNTAAAGSIANAGSGSASVSTGADVQPIVFPTDYARTGEAAVAAGAVVQAIEALAEAPAVENPEIAIPVLGDVQAQFYGENNKITGLLGWTMPAYSVQCPTADLSFDWGFSWSATFHEHCTIADSVRPIMAGIFDSVWLIMAFLIVLGA